MFVPQTFGLALLLMVISALCWGSWANSFKGTRQYRFELFYWDYAIGIVLIALVLAFTLGSMHHDGTNFVANVKAAGLGNIASALAAGLVFNIANLLLVAGIDMAGLALAFPVSIGIALVVGVVSSYIQLPRGNAALLALGVAAAVLAIVLDGLAYAQLGGEGKQVTRKSLIICIISGILMGSFAPLIGRAMNVGSPLGPYSVAVFFTIGAFLCCFVANVYLMRRPLVGDPVRFADYFSAGGRNHALGVIGGSVWGLGTVLNFVAASLTGMAISWAIGQAATIVAAFWGVFIWKEFKGAPPKSRLYLAGMFVFYILAIGLVSLAYTRAA
jgi:glucose uptake protein